MILGKKVVQLIDCFLMLNFYKLIQNNSSFSGFQTFTTLLFLIRILSLGHLDQLFPYIFYCFTLKLSVTLSLGNLIWNAALVRNIFCIVQLWMMMTSHLYQNMKTYIIYSSNHERSWWGSMISSLKWWPLVDCSDLEYIS